MNWYEEVKETSENDKDDLTRLDFYETRKAEGEFHFSFTYVKFNPNAGENKDREVLSLIDGETDTIVWFYCTPHPDSLNQDPSKTDGQKVARAITRAMNAESVMKGIELINSNGGGKLSVTKNPFKDSWAWLFQVKA